MPAGEDDDLPPVARHVLVDRRVVFAGREQPVQAPLLDALRDAL